MYAHEKMGGRTKDEKQMEAFRSTLEVCGLADMGFKGKKFTWEG